MRAARRPSVPEIEATSGARALDGHVSTAADLCAVGVVLCEALTGQFRSKARRYRASMSKPARLLPAARLSLSQELETQTLVLPFARDACALRRSSAQS